MIEEQPVDLYYVPRVNTVSRITSEHIEKWGWSQNQSGWINFPDYQSRIYKKNARIAFFVSIFYIPSYFLLVCSEIFTLI